MQAVGESDIVELLNLIGDPSIISFAGGVPDPELFPVARLREAYADIFADTATTRMALQYSTSEGYGPLRGWIADRMRHGGVASERGNIVLTAGCQQALDLCGKLFLSAGDRLAVSSPTYLGALQAFNVYEPAILSFQDIDHLQAMVRDGERPDLIYVMPDFANPSGECLSLAERHALLDTAEACDAIILEDAAYRDIPFNADLLPSVMALDLARSGGIEAARTLFCGTFSKTVSPSLRVGWICAARPVIEKIVLLKQGADVQVSTINQVVTLRAVSEGFDDHLALVRRAYANRAAVMDRALSAHMPSSVAWSRPTGGLFVWLHLPPGMDAAALLVRAIAEQKVAFVPGRAFFANGKGNDCLRLSYSLPSDVDIDEGLRRLGQLIATGST
jgi:DNA-binding transcriptional MocR family regulator